MNEVVKGKKKGSNWLLGCFQTPARQERADAQPECPKEDKSPGVVEYNLRSCGAPSCSPPLIFSFDPPTSCFSNTPKNTWGTMVLAPKCLTRCT